MIFTIDIELLKNQDYEFEEVLYLFLLEYGKSPVVIPPEILQKLSTRQLVYNTLGGIAITPLGRDTLNKLTFYQVSVKKADYKPLAIKLQNIYPEGRKGETAYYWRGSMPEIVKKLQTFFAKYPKVTEEQVIQATTNYVTVFKANTTYMQLLKYFIEKDGNSTLMAYIEHLSTHQVYEKEDWTSNLV